GPAPWRRPGRRSAGGGAGGPPGRGAGGHPPVGIPAGQDPDAGYIGESNSQYSVRPPISMPSVAPTSIGGTRSGPPTSQATPSGRKTAFAPPNVAGEITV